MPSVLAIVSKAVFEKEARGLGAGDVWPTALYASQNKGLASLGGDGDLYLVTVRPPATLCLVAVLERPKLGKDGWRAKPNTVAIREIDALLGQFQFAGGAPLPRDTSKLGMSLQTPRVLTDADVALLRTGKSSAKSAPAKSQPAKSAPPKTAIAAPSKSFAGKGDLASAQRALAEGDLETGLAGLLAVWRTSPSAELAAAIRKVSDAGRVDVPHIGGKKKANEAWNAAAVRARELEKPAILDRLADAGAKDGMARLDLVARWLPDPRVDELVVKLLESPPFTSTGAHPFFTRMFLHAKQFSDPSLLPRLEAADKKLAALTSNMEYHRTKLAKLLAEVKPRLAALPSGPPLALEVAAPAGARELDQLLAAVYADPASDEPRQIYADALAERDDPRGEFITLQLRLASAPDAALKKREKELLDAHGAQWLGPLAQFVKFPVFERGFLAEARIEYRLPERKQHLAGLPIWSTVRTFHGPAAIGLHPVMKSLRELGFDAVEDSEHAADLLTKTSRPIEKLWIRLPDSTEAMLAETKALPALRELTVNHGYYPAQRTWLGKLATASPLARRLDMLGIDTEVSADAGWWQELVPSLTTSRIPRVELEVRPSGFHPQIYKLHRGATGYERAELTIGPTVKSSGWSGTLIGNALAILRSLPALRELDATLRKNVDPADRTRFTREVGKLKLARVAIS